VRLTAQRKVGAQIADLPLAAECAVTPDEPAKGTGSVAASISSWLADRITSSASVQRGITAQATVSGAPPGPVTCAASW
jgi:hypothetical protein